MQQQLVVTGQAAGAVKQLAFMALFFAAAGCNKRVDLVEAEMIRHCTGTYLRVNGKDYHVCNLEKVSAFKNGDKLSVAFEQIAECHGSAVDVPVCAALYLSESWIEVKTVK